MLVWMVLVPFVTAGVFGTRYLLFPHQSSRLIPIWGSLAMAGTFFCAVVLSFSTLGRGEVLSYVLGHWISVGEYTFDLKLYLDALSSLFVIVLTGLGFFVQLYAWGDQPKTSLWVKYLAYFHLCYGFVLLLLTASSTHLFFVGWQGVSVCGFLLMGYGYENHEKFLFKKNVFISHRLGDAALVMFIAIGVQVFGTLEFATISPLQTNGVLHASYYPVWKLEGLALLLFIACMTKAALFPLYISIPQTAKAPTAFFVLLGVILPCMTGIYAISRCAQLFATTSIVSHIALWIGLMTALFGALVAIFQYDIKKVVAYSVITHVGCAVTLIGMGSYAAGVCYALTSTCVHVLLGLGAGSIVRGVHKTSDLRKMGGLKTRMIATSITMICGYVSIIGIPVSSGFFSKNNAFHHVLVSGEKWVFILFILIAVLTVVYMTRLMVLTLLGSDTRLSLEQTQKIRESPTLILIPLWVLAMMSLFGGWLVFAMYEVLTKSLPQFQYVHLLLSKTEIQLGVGVTFLVFLIVAMTIRYYGQKSKMIEKEQRNAFLCGAKKHWYVDRFMTAGGSILMRVMASIAHVFEWLLSKGVRDAITFVLQSFGYGIRSVATGVIQSYIFFILLGIVFLMVFSLRY